MDGFLVGSGLEPQLAIPVIVVVVGALLVYIFGFQKTEEPSYEHLAILQSSSSYKNRSISSNTKQTKSSSGTSAGNKPKANGHVVSDKEKNGVIKKVIKTEVNKENKPPQVKVQVKKDKVKEKANKPEDFESGDWIPAVSRKKNTDKKNKKRDDLPGQEPSSPSKQNEEKEAAPVKAPRIEDLLEQMKVLKESAEAQKQNHSTQTSPEKKVVAATGKEKSVDSTPAKQAKTAPEVNSAPAAEDKTEALKENAAPEIIKNLSEPSEEPKKKDAKSNIAFDEMGGDTWEEAKSRGTKKRRTRKD